MVGRLVLVAAAIPSSLRAERITWWNEPRKDPTARANHHPDSQEPRTTA
jgi:hypothetical protein